MNERFDILEKQSNDTNSRLEKLSNDTNSRLEKLSMGINELRGDMTERNLRHEVRKMYGDTFGMSLLSKV